MNPLNSRYNLFCIIRNDVTFLNNTKNELETRIEKYRPRIEELEEQSSKHNQLHDKMKIRLTEMNDKILAKSQEVIIKFNSFN